MEIIFEIKDKGHKPSIRKTLRLAERFNDTSNNHRIVVEVEELSEDFANLLLTIAHLSKTTLFVDGIQIDKRGYKLHEILTCPKFHRCNGVCTLDSYLWDSITYSMGLRKGRKNNEMDINGFDESIFDRFGRNILVDSNENEFTINRDRLLEAYLEHFQLERLLCSKFVDSKYLKDLSDFDNQQTFSIRKEDDILETLSISNEDSSEEIKEKNQKAQQELLNRIGDVVEERIRRIISEIKT